MVQLALWSSSPPEELSPLLELDETVRSRLVALMANVLVAVCVSQAGEEGDDGFAELEDSP